MSSKNNRYVVKHRDGWAVKAPGSQRASAVTPTQAAASARGRAIVGNAGGGELVTQGRNGKWRDSDTVPPGHDPCPPRDKR